MLPSMFEDIRLEGPLDETASDRKIVYAIWSRDTASKLAPHEGWKLLADRYPNDARFLLFATYEEYEGHAKDWTPADFLNRVWTVLERAGGKLNPEVRDLLAVVWDDLHGLEEPAAARLERIRGRVGSRFGDAAAARKRLVRLIGTVVREIHERTQGSGSIASLRAAAPASEWSQAVANATGERTKYDATAKVEVGALIDHPKFGTGVVIGKEPGRANILFESGARKLVIG
jgi:hypothetical protein